METSVSPEGSVSVTETVPPVGPAEAEFDTVTVYAAPFCPSEKVPVWVLEISNTGRGSALSVAVAEGDPPPDTVTEFKVGGIALAEIFAVTVMGGKLAPPARASERVQVLPEHVQPAPLMVTEVNPEGAVSVTVTVSEVEGAWGVLDTIIVN